MPEISVVIPFYNEEQNVLPLLNELLSALKGFDYELILVDDGSTDGTLGLLRQFTANNIVVLELRKNYGQSLSLMAGIDMALGEYIVTLDGDLQNDPDDLPAMINLAKKEGWDLVAGIRGNRKDNFLSKALPSRIANWIIRAGTGIKLKDYGCAIKVFRNETAKGLRLYGELHRFITVLAHLDGAKITQVEVRHRPRSFGKSKYGINRTFKVIADLLLILFFKKYLQRPLHFFGILGLWLFLFGAFINFYLLYLKLLGHDIWGKPLLLLGLMLVIGGIQLFTIGVLVEMQVRTYFESQDKRPYKIRKIYTHTGTN